MADYEPPSFSLGLDLDFDTEPQIAASDLNSRKAAPVSSLNVTEPRPLDDVEGSQIVVSDAETGAGPHRVLKRLRRGPPTSYSSIKERQSPPPFCAVDDEIEEFSPQKEFLGDDHALLSTQYKSVCSSSKIPLHGFLSSPLSSQLKRSEKKQASSAPESTSFGTNYKETMFPKLTISPVRRFQLVESDSDEPSGEGIVSRKGDRLDPCPTEQHSKPSKSPFATASEQKEEVLASISQNDDLWKDFRPAKSFQIPTPALDEFCKEYFNSPGKSKVANKLGGGARVNSEDNHTNKSSPSNDGLLWEMADCPPAHHYFFHDDPKIQKLVRDRLPYFSPLGVFDDKVNKQSTASVIDYMRQFSNGEASIRKAPQKTNVEERWVDPKIVSPLSNGKASKQRATKKTNNEKSSRKGRNNSRKSNSEEALQETGSWMDPKSSSGLPKDAGQRRVHASGQSSGHWYTSSDGRKVYVSKSGQELTGSTAYRNYKKEKAGPRKSTKKGQTNKRKR